MGLFRSYDRAELSWEEIGKIGINRSKELVKGMFCNEDGFSLKRTLTTLGTAAAFAAIAAIPGVGPAIALTGGAALCTYTAYKGTGKVLEGKKEYYNAKHTKKRFKRWKKQWMAGLKPAYLFWHCWVSDNVPPR